MAGDAKPFTTEEWWSDYESCRSDKPLFEPGRGCGDGHLLGHGLGNQLSRHRRRAQSADAGSRTRAHWTALAALFGAHAIDGTVKIEYDTEVYYGLLD